MIILINIAYRLLIIGVILLMAPILAIITTCAFLLMFVGVLGFVLTKPVLDTAEDDHYVSWSRGYYRE
tara:strand:+ start:298 stop:501 length:204 start_codon:yes stop_codon:yes gene_type:complete